jgi:uncharacterized protein (DUF302 family)
MDTGGLVTLPSDAPFAATLARLLAALQARNITVFAQIDHAAGAQSVTMPLRPTTVVIFGNPAAGTPLMQAEQRMGLDLPLKALVWEDEHGGAHVSYRDPAKLAAQHGVDAAKVPAVQALSNAMAALAKAATTA